MLISLEESLRCFRDQKASASTEPVTNNQDIQR